MTDEQIMLAAGDVDVFVTELMNEYKMNIIDISAVINSRLRMISALDELQDDFDDLIDHVSSQTVVVSKTIH
jgi:hypothetical protein